MTETNKLDNFTPEVIEKIISGVDGTYMFEIYK